MIASGELPQVLASCGNDLYQMLKAFTEQDPDKNGKNDTVGVTIMISNNSISFDLSSAFGAPNNWSETAGKFVKAEETPEYLEYLKFMKKLYEGYAAALATSK
ncbi:hypothetical protein NYE69_29175 [Paenibacillus sp. FSL R5-0527]|uniref:hypothetical protein n=1 Tax=Paenibacillus sp. FSL R5-0527 TaxID=2975321 RepID=UPI000979F61A|nr:hypothetical protein BK140_14480 [Paenibacillus macerans]